MCFQMELTGQAPRAVAGASQHRSPSGQGTSRARQTQPNGPHSGLVLVSSTVRAAGVFKQQESKIRKTAENTANVEIAGTGSGTQIWVCLTETVSSLQTKGTMA